MAGDSIGEKLKDLPVVAKVGAVVGAVLLLALVWVWWPEPAPKIDPATQQALDAQKNDKAANPPDTYVPNPSDGPRRKATKAN